MANFLTSLFGRKDTSVIGLDVGSSSIKVVQLTRKNGRAVLETYGELALGPYGGVEVGRATNLSPEKIAGALVDVLRESKTTTTSAGLAIPFGSSLITSVEMPAATQKQFNQIIPIEARKYIPVPISEVTLDWWVIPKTGSGPAFDKEPAAKPAPDDKVNVLLVAIHNDILYRFQSIINNASLKASFFEIEIFSAVRSVVDEGITSQMIIDLGAGTTKIYIVEEGIVRSSHIVNRGAQDVTLAMSRALGVSVQNAEIMKRDMNQVSPEKRNDVASVIAITLDFIFSEAHQVMLGYQRKFNKDIPKVTLVGGGALLKGILPYAEARLQTRVIFGDPFSKMECPAFLADILKATGPEFAVAVGVAMRKLTEL